MRGDLDYLIPDGYSQAGPLTSQSGIVTVLAGIGMAGVPEVVLVELDIPVGAKALLLAASIRVVDQAGYDQLIFCLTRNCGKIMPFDKISGEQTTEDQRIPIEQVFDAGLMQLRAINISGQPAAAWPDAGGDFLNIRVIARLQGVLLRETRRFAA